MLAQVTHEEEKDRTTRTIVTEMGGGILMHKTYNVEDGRIIRVETLTLLDERTATTRARVTQLFGSASDASTLTVFSCVESRVDTTQDELVPSGSPRMDGVRASERRHPPEFDL